MGWRERLFGRAGAETRATLPISVTQSSDDFWKLLGLESVHLPHVTVESALQVPAVSAAVTFLSSSMASLPLHLFDGAGGDAKKVDKGLGIVLRDAANEELSSFDWRKWAWQQYFTGGRACTYIERNARGEAVSLWPMDPAHLRIERKDGRTRYVFGNSGKVYAAADVIDWAWMRKRDLVGHYSPIQRGAKAIQLALAMNDYSSKLFAKGGMPPLSLHGPLPTGADAMKRAGADVSKALDAARDQELPVIQLPTGFELKPVGFDPQKGQLVEGKKYLIGEIARLYNLPPVFLQDLEFGTFSNTEQQDLHLVKHSITQLCVMAEQEMNLKLFGPKVAKRYVRHNIDGLLRGDFKTRMDGYSTAINAGVLKPSDAREKENLPSEPGSDRLFVQGAMVPMDQAGFGNNGAGGAGDAD